MRSLQEFPSTCPTQGPRVLRLSSLTIAPEVTILRPIAPEATTVGICWKVVKLSSVFSTVHTVEFSTVRTFSVAYVAPEGELRCFCCRPLSLLGSYPSVP